MTKFASVLDAVLAEATQTVKQRTEQAVATKVAEAQLRTELGAGLRSLAQQVRTMNDDITYGDLS